MFSIQAQNDAWSLRDTLMSGCCLERTDSAWTLGKFSGNSKKGLLQSQGWNDDGSSPRTLTTCVASDHTSISENEYEKEKDLRGLPANLDLGHGQHGGGS